MGKPPLFLVFGDDNYVHVYLAPEVAAIQIEALDVEETARRMFDSEARPYRVEWRRPNRKGKWFGFLRWVENASGIESSRDSAVAEVKALELRLRTETQA